jgi:hypothetical protein
VATAITEELAFWRSEDSANPDIETLRALRPSLQTVEGSLLIGISTPYSKSGALFSMFKEHYGKPGPTLIWKAASSVMNPTLSLQKIDGLIAEDPEAGRAEWLGEFREDISTFIPTDLVEGLVIPGRIELPPITGVKYQAFADPSGGSSDSFTLAIAHRSEDRIIIDALRERRPPFSAEDVVSEFAETLHGYGVVRVTGDKYAGEWPSQSFKKFGVDYIPAEKTASEIYLEALPLLTTGAVELPDSKRLRAQLANLERRARPGGRDLIAHGPGTHDDLVNAVAGVLLMAGQKPKRLGRVFLPSRPPAESSSSDQRANPVPCADPKKFGPGRKEGKIFVSESAKKKTHDEIVQSDSARWRKPPPFEED